VTGLAKRITAAASGLGAAALLHGCAGIQTTVPNADAKLEGVAYYLPMRYFMLSVVREKGATKSAEWTESPLVPDSRRAYTLSFNPHLIGKTDITIQVNSVGLLSTANTKTTDSAVELGTVKPIDATIQARGQIVEPQVKCADDGNFVYLFDPTETPTIACEGIQISIKPLPLTVAGTPKVGAPTTKTFVDADAVLKSAPGVFYRQQRPYLVHVSVVEKRKTTIDVNKVLLAPNQSPVVLLPYARTLFAANEGKIVLVDGMPQSYVQSTDGEFVALLKVPAAVLTAYFTAIGSVFNAFSTKATKEYELAVKEYKLSLAAYKLERCKEAFEKGDKTSMDTLQCASISTTP
jgi:hypothetical protein